MKIGLDVRELAKPKAGKAVYLLELLKAFSRISNHQLILYTDRRFSLKRLGLAGDLKLRILPGRGLIWQWRLAKILKLETDLFFSALSYVAASLTQVRTVLVVHDLASFLFPKFSTPKTRLVERFFLPVAARRAKMIFVSSKSTKKDLLNLIAVPPDRVRVSYLGVNKIYFEKVTELKIKEILNRYRLPKNFLLFLGTLEPRKNLERLIEGFFLLSGKLKRQYILVIAGRKGWKYRPIFRAVEELELTDRVVFLDYIEDGDLPALYQAARALVFPAYYEGFGLPPLEAMASGLPVLVSRAGSLPEVVGGAGFYVETENPRTIAKAVEMVLKNPALTKKRILIGRERASSFSWQKTASQVLSGLDEVFKASG